PGSVTVQVLDEEYNEIKGAKVTLSGKTSGGKDTDSDGFAAWPKVEPDPEGKYSVKVAVAHLEKYKDHEVRFNPKGPKCDTSPLFPMPPGGTKSVIFGVYAPVTSLVVKVVDQRGRAIQDHDFKVVVPGHSATGQTGQAAEARFPNIKPGQYK